MNLTPPVHLETRALEIRIMRSLGLVRKQIIIDLRIGNEKENQVRDLREIDRVLRGEMIEGKIVEMTKETITAEVPPPAEKTDENAIETNADHQKNTDHPTDPTSPPATNPETLAKKETTPPVVQPNLITTAVIHQQKNERPTFPETSASII